jgi:TetR/AcrR family transcriptional regulator, regulator of autoinduction and epiphytic fitness
MSGSPVKRPDEATSRSSRRYRSPKREQAARETRRRVRAAAEALFLRDGYVRTTTKGIAKEAGVAEMTVFLAFANKAALLSEIIRVRVRGDDEEAPMAARASWQDMLGAPGNEILARFAELNGEILARTARVLVLAEAAAAADGELAVQRDRSHAHIRSDFQQVADALANQGCLSATTTPERAGDVMFALVNEVTYLRLIDECGWSTAEYVAWLTRSLQATLGSG